MADYKSSLIGHAGEAVNGGLALLSYKERTRSVGDDLI